MSRPRFGRYDVTVLGGRHRASPIHRRRARAASLRAASFIHPQFTPLRAAGTSSSTSSTTASPTAAQHSRRPAGWRRPRPFSEKGGSRALHAKTVKSEANSDGRHRPARNHSIISSSSSRSRKAINLPLQKSQTYEYEWNMRGHKMDAGRSPRGGGSPTTRGGRSAGPPGPRSTSGGSCPRRRRPRASSGTGGASCGRGSPESRRSSATRNPGSSSAAEARSRRRRRGSRR